MIVYLDMDGVIADFVTGTAKLLNQLTKGMYDEDPPTEWELGPHFGLSNNEIFRRLDGAGEQFWRKLQPTRCFERLVERLRYTTVVVLTAITRSPSCASGKVAWLQHWFKTPVILTSAPKALLAKPDTVLIDDKEENVRDFLGAGGRAILWPAPWNSEAADFPNCEAAFARLDQALC
jgi:5'(3')-deoxyribonucleotidase